MSDVHDGSHVHERVGKRKDDGTETSTEGIYVNTLSGELTFSGFSVYIL